MVFLEDICLKAGHMHICTWITSLHTNKSGVELLEEQNLSTAFGRDPMYCKTQRDKYGKMPLAKSGGGGLMPEFVYVWHRPRT